MDWTDIDWTDRTAVLADIHGNALALGAVLEDIAAQGITQVVNLGDIFSGPLDPAGVWEQLKGRGLPTLRGNHDRYLIEGAGEDLGPTDRLTASLLPKEAFDWIRGLPEQLHWDGVFACHATPGDDNTYWTEQVVEGGTSLAPPAAIEALATGIEAGLILYAHTHIPRVLQLADGRVMVNPGSVGCPAYTDTAPRPHVVQTGSPFARYAVVHRDPGGWRVSHHAVRYDFDAAAEQARTHGRDDWARAVGTGWLG
ncbi:metallophosphoesterase family protein [Pseudooceanicola nitratireducens]|uniref:metallophosphoesterase family protein n=1 Tax=Pseudooceanicola nitratireducens TaxID=517719 RepID=UPI0021BC1EA7|nr:metallophosphoesterase family protein [Pseudooceanicola nitratireducens]